MRSDRSFWMSWLVTACIGGTAPVVQAAEWNASLGLTSDYIVRGLTRSQHDGAVQGNVSLQGEQPWTAGIWASSVTLYDGGPRHAEVDYFLAGELPLSNDWQLGGQATRYQFIGGSSAVSYDYSELALSLSFQDTITASVSWSPDYTYVYSYPGHSGYSGSGYSGGIAAATDTSVSYELTARHPLSRHVLAVAGVGHTELGDPDRAYSFWSGGAEISWDRVALNLSYLSSDNDARRLFRNLASQNVWVATLSVRLH